MEQSKERTSIGFHPGHAFRLTRESLTHLYRWVGEQTRDTVDIDAEWKHGKRNFESIDDFFGYLNAPNLRLTRLTISSCGDTKDVSIRFAASPAGVEPLYVSIKATDQQAEPLRQACMAELKGQVRVWYSPLSQRVLTVAFSLAFAWSVYGGMYREGLIEPVLWPGTFLATSLANGLRFWIFPRGRFVLWRTGRKSQFGTVLESPRAALLVGMIALVVALLDFFFG